MLGEMGNLVVKVDVKENVKEWPMMANTELLKAWISFGKANSVPGRQIRLLGSPRRVWVTQSYPGHTKVT
jgi:hypothetical protein